MGGAPTGPRGYEVLESRNQRARWIGAAVPRDRSGANLAGCAAARPRHDRRVGWGPCRRKLQREPQRDRHHPRRPPTPPLSGPSSRSAERDTSSRGCCNLHNESTSPGLRRSDSIAAEGGLRPLAEAACAGRARAHPRSASQRASADQPTTGNGREQADPLGLQGREPHELESHSFP